MNISILLFEEVDLLDAGGPYEVFLTANRLMEREGFKSPFNVSNLTIDDQPVTAYGGLGLIPNGKIEQLNQTDVLIVPGTINIDKATVNRPLIDIIKSFSSDDNKNRVTASVCTGAFLLAEAGLLSNRQWTTHFEDIELLAQKLQKNSLKHHGATNQERWVDSGSIVTAAGLTTGIDMALHLVERFTNRALAEKTAKQIEYNWMA